MIKGTTKVAMFINRIATRFLTAFSLKAIHSSVSMMVQELNCMVLYLELLLEEQMNHLNQS